MTSSSSAGRALWVALAMLGLAVGAFLLRQNGPTGVPWLPDCMFHKVTGLHCPGCGMTRATHAALHGRILDAFRFNPVGMVLLPIAGLGLALEIAGWVRGKPLPFALRPGRIAGWSLVVLIVGFWVLRNIPVWPFTLLAPH